MPASALAVLELGSWIVAEFVDAESEAVAVAADTERTRPRLGGMDSATFGRGEVDSGVVGEKTEINGGTICVGAAEDYFDD